MHIIKSESGFEAWVKQRFPGREVARRKNEKEREMFDFDHELRAGRVVTLFFAFLTSVTAISSAVLPAIVHI